MKDEIKSVLSQLSDRLTSPIFGSFVISWLLWNHRYIFILLSDLPINARFSLIERTLYPDWQHLIGRGFIAPALMSLVYITWYQDLSRWILARWDRRQTELNEARHEAQKKRRLTVEDSLKVWSDAQQAEKVWGERAESQSKEIERLKAELGRLVAQGTSEVEAAVAREKAEWQSRLHEEVLLRTPLENEILYLKSQLEAAKRDFRLADNERTDLKEQISVLKGEAPHAIDTWPDDERMIVERIIRLAAKAYPYRADNKALFDLIFRTIPNAIERDRFLERLGATNLVERSTDGWSLTPKGREVALRRNWHKDEVQPPPMLPPAQLSLSRSRRSGGSRSIPHSGRVCGTCTPPS